MKPSEIRKILYTEADKAEADKLHFKFVTALTEFDRKSKGKTGYNPHALALYLEALERTEKLVKSGMNMRKALLQNFTGRLLPAMFKVAGLGKPSDTEQRHGYSGGFGGDTGVDADFTGGYREGTRENESVNEHVTPQETTYLRALRDLPQHRGDYIDIATAVGEDQVEVQNVMMDLWKRKIVDKVGSVFIYKAWMIPLGEKEINEARIKPLFGAKVKITQGGVDHGKVGIYLDWKTIKRNDRGVPMIPGEYHTVEELKRMDFIPVRLADGSITTTHSWEEVDKKQPSREEMDRFRRSAMASYRDTPGSDARKGYRSPKGELD